MTNSKKKIDRKDAAITCRKELKLRIKEQAERYRLSDSEFMEVLIISWANNSPEQQVAAITNEKETQ